MLFEKLEYFVKLKEFIDKQDKLLRQEITAKNLCKYNQEVVNAAHEEELRKLFQYVSDLKVLYASKLDEYDKQLQLARKGTRFQNLNFPSPQKVIELSDKSALSPLLEAKKSPFKRMLTTNEQKSTKTMREEEYFEVSPVRKVKPLEKESVGISAFEEDDKSQATVAVKS